MSVPTKYVPRTAPATYQRAFHSEEGTKVQLSLNSIIALLGTLEVPIEIGPADSAGIGFRSLRIPN